MNKQYLAGSNRFLSFFAIILTFILFFACTQKDAKESLVADWIENGTQETKSDNLIINNPINNTIYPPDFSAPTIEWEDKEGDESAWLVIINIEKEVITSAIINEKKWKLDTDIWEKIKNKTIDKEATISVLAINSVKQDKILYGASVNFKTSKDSVVAPIFFRAVTLPFSYAVANLGTIKWCLGDVSSEREPSVLLANMPVCSNCHSFTKNGKTLGMDVDYANDKGSYIIADVEKKIFLTNDKIITWSDYKREDKEQTFGLLSNMSPDGRYVLSTVKDRSIFVPINNLFYSQLFFSIKGILAYYDIDKKEYHSLPGADDPAFVQSNPNWSPDGETIIFAKSEVFMSKEIEKSRKAVLPTEVASDFIEGKREFKYDLCQIQFNEGQGGIAEPLPGASDNGMSNFFPKFSPDGKWLVYCQANNFMLLQPDSKLYIIPAAGGTPRLMNCNTSSMNSWHSWSPNGKWMVFSSKQRGAFTQLYLTHIDENGNDSPPVYLENFSVAAHAANIPEFVNIEFSDMQTIVEKFMHLDYYAELRGKMKGNRGDLYGALEEYDRAISLNPEEYSNYFERGLVKIELRDYSGAIKDFDETIKLNPKYPEAYFEKGYVCMERGKFEDANKQFEKAVQLNPEYTMAFYEHGMSNYYLENYQNAIMDFDKVISLKPESEYAFYHRGLCKIQIGWDEQACKDLDAAVKLGCPEAIQAFQEFCSVQ